MYKAPSFQDFWADIDIYLDSFPWSGHTMACHALWCGVPVVTLAGRSHASRMVASVLASLGLEDWIAEHEPGYIEAVVALAADTEALASLRDGLRARMASAGLTDGERFARQFEAALADAWSRLERIGNAPVD